MSQGPTRLLDDRIAAMILRVKVLAAERDEFERENAELRSQLETQEREHARLRTVLDEAARELRQGQEH
jgi:predicted RNase H-like nuclease (RuvC/YqgF family)